MTYVVNRLDQTSRFRQRYKCQEQCSFHHLNMDRHKQLDETNIGKCYLKLVISKLRNYECSKDHQSNRSSKNKCLEQCSFHRLRCMGWCKWLAHRIDQSTLVHKCTGRHQCKFRCFYTLESRHLEHRNEHFQLGLNHWTRLHFGLLLQASSTRHFGQCWMATLFEMLEHNQLDFDKVQPNLEMYITMK